MPVSHTYLLLSPHNSPVGRCCYHHPLFQVETEDTERSGRLPSFTWLDVNPGRASPEASVELKEAPPAGVGHLRFRGAVLSPQGEPQRGSGGAETATPRGGSRWMGLGSDSPLGDTEFVR